MLIMGKHLWQTIRIIWVVSKLKMMIGKTIQNSSTTWKINKENYTKSPNKVEN